MGSWWGHTVTDRIRPSMIGNGILCFKTLVSCQKGLEGFFFFQPHMASLNQLGEFLQLWQYSAQAMGGSGTLIDKRCDLAWKCLKHDAHLEGLILLHYPHLFRES